MDTKRNPRTGGVMVVFGVVLVCVLCSGAYGQPWDGNGVEGDPYQIWTAEDMQAIGGNSAYWSAHFELMADIDLSAYTGESFNQIGRPGHFSGVFDGDGHTISNFTYVAASHADYTGLFGTIDGADAGVKNLGLINPTIDAGPVSGRYNTAALVGGLGSMSSSFITNCYVQGGSIKGDSYVGGLVGENKGIISNCYTNCSVRGDKSHVGGLVGENDGTISNCYSLGSVRGQADVGGLVGRSDYSAETYHCYSVGVVDGNDFVGGLVGYADNSDIYTACFWDSDVNPGLSGIGNRSDPGVTGQPTANMQMESTFTDAGWDFVGESTNGTDEIWVIREGTDYPRHAWTGYYGGNGTEVSPYLIYTAAQMNAVGAEPNDWDKHFKLMADIDLAAYTGTSFNLIGEYHGYGHSNNKAFTGVFDGNGHSISNFIYTFTGPLMGLFRYVSGSSAVIRNLTLIDPNTNAGTADVVGILIGSIRNGATVSNCHIQNGHILANNGNGAIGGLVGYSFANIIDSSAHVTVTGYGNDGGLVGLGGLVGCNAGTITNCYVAGVVDGNDDWAGGLVGYNDDNGVISHCYASASVEGTHYVGGLAGENWGSISDSNASGGVTGTWYTGGLVGFNRGPIVHCHSQTNVTGDYAVGGLTGASYTGSISNCYATGSPSGNLVIGGLVGLQESGTITNCYSTGRASGNEAIGGLMGYKKGGNITNCYSTGSVSGNSAVGGLVGGGISGVDANSFWDVNSSGLNVSSGGGTPKTTVEMQTESTFTDAGWDFVGEVINGANDIWTICEGVDYPRLEWQVDLVVDIDVDELWMYQSLPGQTNSTLTVSALSIGDASCNSSYSYEWEIVLPGDVTLAPVTVDGGGASDAYWTFAARGCDEPGGLSDSGQTFTVRVTVTGDDYGNTGQAEDQFGIALLGDVNNDGVVDVADRAIVNGFWRTGSAGPFSSRDCDLNCDGDVELIDRVIANAVWRGALGQDWVSSPCPLR